MSIEATQPASFIHFTDTPTPQPMAQGPTVSEMEAVMGFKFKSVRYMETVPEMVEMDWANYRKIGDSVLELASLAPSATLNLFA